MNSSLLATTSSDGPAADETDLPLQRAKTLVIMGPRSSGKTSIVATVLDQSEPSDTLYIESTTRPTLNEFTVFTKFNIWDYPGNTYDLELAALSHEDVHGVIYVVDGQAFQADTSDVAHKIALSVCKIWERNTNCLFSVFVHKTDGFSFEYQKEILEEIQFRFDDELFDLLPANAGIARPSPAFYLTSIYGPTINVAMSKVLQSLMPAQATLEKLADLMNIQCSFEKVFLFHLPTRLYFTTDSSPFDKETHEICSDYIDLVMDIGGLYKPHERSKQSQPGSRDASPARIKTMQKANGTVQPRSYQYSRVKVASGKTLALWGIDENLALIAIISPNVLERPNQFPLVEYNVGCFREAVQQIKTLEKTAHLHESVS
ncbi:uncharacterized protein L969DRAFT_85082 [Mixia osmundae IAM 14324]|uniref:GTP-binding protein n=1 Tax=Mixia osmundae (strain CBS 9802 / IAM 14324 / JCM 22182 / KY 12970) TaxID=764103 RepID=G7DXU5_MIXOS|nr:uncharacterized protein L969DRAFT_85082 [Mixia osmundae IAM 14324]KEI41308.1 hypothetical protein L969DRAFT_85082 [Mixia osmundae IAM 14324]GAA95405.1 hypothetical protein E5Q_02059 [Mixia osmundae IAM 14324]